MRISDWSSDVCSSDLVEREAIKARLAEHLGVLETLRAEHEALLKTHAACAADTERANTLGPRSDSTDLHIVGGLLTLLLGNSPKGMTSSKIAQSACRSEVCVDDEMSVCAVTFTNKHKP